MPRRKTMARSKKQKDGALSALFAWPSYTGHIESVVGRPGAQTIEGILKNTSSPEGNILMMVIGAVILFLAASGVFAELQDSLNTIFKAPKKETTGLLNTIRMRFLSFAMVL